MASRFASVTSEENIHCAVYYLTVLVYTKTTIHLQTMPAEFGPENVVIFAGINDLKSYFCAVYTKKTIHLSVGN